MRHTWVIDMEAKDGRDIPHDDFMEALADAFDFPFGAEVKKIRPEDREKLAAALPSLRWLSRSSR